VAKKRTNSGQQGASRRGPAGKRERPGSGRRKSCPYCKDKIEHADYKDVETLKRFVSDRGKIRSRRITGACRRHQSQIAAAVKRAREIALLPYAAEPTREDGPRGRRDRREERE
jgi:small subunit ribosomal protein S18